MAEDIHVIKPVEGLQNIAQPTPAKRREQRKNRQSLGKKKPPRLSAEHSFDEETAENDDDRNTVDYCA